VAPSRVFLPEGRTVISLSDAPRWLLTITVRRMPAERSDWGAAMLAELAQLRNPSARWWFALGCARAALFPPRRGGSIQTYRSHLMKNITNNPRAAALIGFLLAMPLMLLLWIMLYEVEPFHGYLKHWFTEADGVRMNALAQIVMIGSVLLLPVALIVNLAPIVRNVRAGNSVMTNPINLLLAVVLFAFITTIVGVFVIDQYPCWIGVPNCD
jgi:hypothetical protein